MLGEDDSPGSSLAAGCREQPDGEVAVAQPSWECSFRWSLLCVNATCCVSPVHSQGLLWAGGSGEGSQGHPGGHCFQGKSLRYLLMFWQPGKYPPCSFPAHPEVNATSPTVFLLFHGPSMSGGRCREPRPCAAQALEDGPTPAMLGQWMQCGHHCLAAALPEPRATAPLALGSQSTLLMKHNPSFQKPPLGHASGPIFSSATSLLLSRLCSSTASRPGVKPFIQQTHSVLMFHLVPSYFWDIVALDLAGCEVQKDPGP